MTALVIPVSRVSYLALGLLLWVSVPACAQPGDPGPVLPDPASVQPLDPEVLEREPVADERSALEISAELEERLRNIERVESELGLFDPALIELYADLARFYREQDDQEGALESYRQAFQLTRISAGLNSEAQLPYIDSVIDSSLDLGDWQQADDMHQLRYYLKNRLYEPADPRFADAVAELGSWKLRTMREGLLGGGYREIGRDAEELSDIYQHSIARIQASPDFRETTLLRLYQGKSQADLEVARYLAETPYQFFEGTVPQFVYQNVCTTVRDAQGNPVRQCTSIRRENPRYRDSQRDNKRMQVYRSVREIETSIRNLNDILARNPDIPPPQREQLDSQIRQLQVEYQRIERNTRSRLLF
jgi:tetratricopeptide (TPR) repeat protein